MKRIFFSSLIIVFVMAVWMAPAALAGPNNKNKVRICHFTNECEWGLVGHYIIVSKNACQKHVDRGDLVSSYQFDDELLNDCPLWNGNCSPGDFCGWKDDPEWGPLPKRDCPE
jgi:hypothetical protein